MKTKKNRTKKNKYSYYLLPDTEARVEEERLERLNAKIEVVETHLWDYAKISTFSPWTQSCESLFTSNNLNASSNSVCDDIVHGSPEKEQV